MLEQLVEYTFLFFRAISYPLYLIHQNLQVYSLIKQFEDLGFGVYVVILQC
jgi:hypothetical protein